MISDYYSFYDGLRMVPPIRLKDTWLVSTFQEVKRLLFEDKVYSVERVELMFPEEILTSSLKAKFARDILEKWIVHMDDDLKHLKKEMIDSIYSYVREDMTDVVASILNDFCASPQAINFDFKFDVCLPIMSTVAMGIYGVAPSEAHHSVQESLIFKHAEIVSLLLEDVSLELNRAEQFATSLLYLLKLGGGFDGLTEGFLESDYDASKYSHFEIQQSLILGTLVYNSVNLISNSFFILSNNKSKFDESNVRGAIVEAIRLESPVQAVLRIAGEDVEVRGQKIKKGDSLTLIIGSANRDGEHNAFEEPKEFRLGRERAPILTFGHGVHACIGQHMIMKIAEMIVCRFLYDYPLIIEKVKWNDTLRGYRNIDTFRVKTN